MYQVFQQCHQVDIEPPSTNWFDLPFEMREMIIDRMDPKTRCRFAQCSRICEKEVTESKYFLHSLETFGYKTPKLEVSLGGDNSFCLEFINADNKYIQTIVVYKSDRIAHNVYKVAKWAKVVLGNPNYVRAKYAKHYLEKYKNSIRVFCFDDAYSLLSDVNLNKLRKLEKLTLDGLDGMPRNKLLDVNKLLHIEQLSIGKCKLTLDQIANFQGKKLNGASDELDVKNTNKYLKMWKNGEIHEKVDFVELSINVLKDAPIINIIDGLDVLEFSKLSGNNGDQICSFYGKSEVGRKRWFYVLYGSHHKLQVHWVKPEDLDEQMNPKLGNY